MVTALKRRIDDLEKAESIKLAQSQGQDPQGTLVQDGEQAGNLGEAYQDTLKLVRENRDRAERAMSTSMQSDSP